ncbi:MAG: VIT1/CCC1 transporter family protein [Nitrososphaerota archaeon]
MLLDDKIRKEIINIQENEISEYFIYKKLSNSIKDVNNKKILEQISNEELKHYNLWKEYTGEEVKPNKLKIWKYFIISKIFGITFGLKLMEKGEEKAQIKYKEISKFVPIAEEIEKDENEHEKQILNLIEEEKLKYVGSMVLGLNDALVEFTGTLAGLTFALQKTSLIAMAGLIAGIAASFSMAASEYLSTKAEEGAREPLKASIYTGIAYIFTVLFLIFPYLILINPYFSLSLTIFNAIIVIFIFTFYISIAKDISFKKRFLEMISISLGIAALSFLIGFLVRIFLGIEI